MHFWTFSDKLSVIVKRARDASASVPTLLLGSYRGKSECVKTKESYPRTSVKGEQNT